MEYRVSREPHLSSSPGELLRECVTGKRGGMPEVFIDSPAKPDKSAL